MATWILIFFSVLGEKMKMRTRRSEDVCDQHWDHFPFYFTSCSYTPDFRANLVYRKAMIHGSYLIHEIFFEHLLCCRLQQYLNCELPDIQVGFRKGRVTRDQVANIRCIIKRSREFQKNICFIDYAKAFDCVDHTKLWKILKEMGIPDHLTCLLRNLYAGQEATVRTGHETTGWFQIGKGVCQSCILSPCLFNLYAEHIMRSSGLDEAQAGIKIAGRNTNNLRYADDTTLMAESEEEPLDESKRGEWKCWLKAQHSEN